MTMPDPTRLTDADLDNIRARCAEATPDPWEPTRSVTCGHLRAGHNWQRDPFVEWTTADVAFIGAARADVPALLAEVDRLRQDVRIAAEVERQLRLRLKALIGK